MFKKIFKVGIIVAIVQLFGIIVCSYLLLYKVNVEPIDLKLIGKFCLYGLSVVVPVLVVSGFFHFFFDPIDPLKNGIKKESYRNNNLHIVR